MGIAFEPFFKVKIISLTDDTQVNSGGGTDTKYLKPDLGYIYEMVLVNIDIEDAAGSTAGTHQIKIIYEASQTEFTIDNLIAFYRGTTGQDITTAYTRPDGPDYEKPSTYIDSTLYEKRYATNTNPLSFQYTNSLDAHQTGTRIIEIMVKEYKEAV